MAIESRYIFRVLKRIYILFQSETRRVYLNSFSRNPSECNKGINSITHKVIEKT